MKDHPMKNVLRHICPALLLVTLMGTAIAPVNAAEKKSAKVMTQNEGVAATVNDEPITLSDVYDRLKLMIVSSGLPNSPEIQQRLKTQVLNMLIEEKLQVQEASQQGITITQEDIDGGFATIAGNNKMEPGEFKAMMQRGGIRVRTLENQIRAQIAWGKVVQRKLRPQIEVSETDIDARETLVTSSLGKTQYQVAQIFLPVDTMQNDAEVKALADRLRIEMTQKNAPFPQVAQQFSQEAAAARGGDLGWVQDGQLPDALSEALVTMQEGALSEPIRSISGYHIVFLRGKRTVQQENLPTRDQLMQQIGTERLDRLQRRYLLDLKADAFVDRRI